MGVAGKEFVHCFTVFNGVSVIGGTDKVLQIFPGVKEFIDLFRKGVSFNEPPVVKKVVLLPQKEHRTGRLRKDQITHFTPLSKDIGGDLLHIGTELVFDVPPPAGDVAAGSRHGETVVKGVEETGHGTAA